jgi:hypothetical protein
MQKGNFELKEGGLYELYTLFYWDTLSPLMLRNTYTTPSLKVYRYMGVRCGS